jgi:prepilin-type N-terminal cleavage/methylation domain-containing protein
MQRNLVLKTRGFTLVEIMIVVAIIGLLAAIAIPNFVKARQTAQRNACIRNLQQIDGAKEQWALETKKGPSDPVVPAEIDAYIKGGAPKCPASGTYTYGNVGTDPTCTIAGHVLPNSAAAGNVAPAGAAAGP